VAILLGMKETAGPVPKSRTFHFFPSGSEGEQSLNLGTQQYANMASYWRLDCTSHRECVTEEIESYVCGMEKEARNTIYNCMIFRDKFKEHPELHGDPVVSRNVLKRYPEALQYIQSPTEQQCNIAFINNYRMIEWIPDALKTATQCQKAVEANPEFLKFVPVRFLTPALYTRAIQSNPAILQKIPEPTFDILEKAFSRNETIQQERWRPYCKDLWSHVPALWKTDSFYTWIYLNFPSHVSYPSEDFKICVRILALHRNPTHIQYLSEPEPSEFEWFTVLKEKPELLKLAPKTIRSKPHIQEYVIQKDPLCLKFCLHPTKEICLKAIERNGNALEHVSQQMQSEHPELVKMALNQTKDALKFAKIALAEYPATWICGAQLASELQFSEASEDLRKRSLEDPDTLEPLQKGEVYGFWLDDEKRWYVAGSRTMFRRFIETKYKGSTMHQVYVPLLKNVMSVQNLQWVVW
jgi:hypothetical protein